VIASHRLDLRDRDALSSLLETYRFDAVMHFAASKAVGESCERPLDYYDNNVGGSAALLQAMNRAKVRRLVFSSSARCMATRDGFHWTRAPRCSPATLRAHQNGDRADDRRPVRSRSDV
jgi:UDP-glucose 4-epimerase